MSFPSFNLPKEDGGDCKALKYYPNATVAEYGQIKHHHSINAADHVNKIKMEIYARGPVAASINGKPLHNFMGGKVYDDDVASRETTHTVSIVGWGVEDGVDGKEYWILRNSWGSYWAEGGFFRVETGKNILGVESKSDKLLTNCLQILCVLCRHIMQTHAPCCVIIFQVQFPGQRQARGRRKTYLALKMERNAGTAQTSFIT